MSQQTSAGVAIRKARQRKRMTQSDLAGALGVSNITVANWESGKHFPQRYAGLIEEVLEITLPEPEAAVS